MAVIPTPYTAGRKALVVGEPDDYGDRPVSYASPVTFPVHWAAPGAMQDFTSPGRDATRVVVTLCTPSPCDVTEHDRVVWKGVEYAVSGRPKDWTDGPWSNPAAAVLIELERKEG